MTVGPTTSVYDGARVGIGLSLRTADGRYLFAVAGTRYRCPRGALFYAGVGGGVEDGETWPQCAKREAREEIGAAIELVESPATWSVREGAPPKPLELPITPRPFAVYAMPAQDDDAAPRVIVVYEAVLAGPIGRLAAEEVAALISLNDDQVVKSISRKVPLSLLMEEKAQLVATAGPIDARSRLHPIGTARALGLLRASGVRGRL